VIATDHDGRLYLARANELVDRQPRARAVSVTEPADARGKSLEGNPLGRQVEPALEDGVVGKQAAERFVDRRDVGLIARESGPAKRPDALTEERPDIGRDEARVCERLLYASCIGLTS